MPGLKRADSRPPPYHYWKQLLAHLSNQGFDPPEDAILTRAFAWPRQWEIHLPNDHKKPCQLHCPHCAGKLFDHGLGRWESKALALQEKLEGAIPFHVYGGAYTEPLGNPYFTAFLAGTKRHGNHFGIHTNGVLLKQLEDTQGFLTEIHALSSDDVDYLSISLDAGLPWSWARTKAGKSTLYPEIWEGIRMACKIRDKAGKPSHAIRVCYLISPESDTPEDFQAVVAYAKACGVDSLRFSIPFDNYLKDFDTVREYKELRETPGDTKYWEMLKPYLSTSKDARPYIFYTEPWLTDVDRFTFHRCAYSYFQITSSADGWLYPCSTVASPTAKHLRLGEATDDVETFKALIKRNQESSHNPQTQCFGHCLRCNRMGVEINAAVEGLELRDAIEGRR